MGVTRLQGLGFRPWLIAMTDELRPDKLAYSIPNFARAVDLSETTVREAINKNDLIVSYPTAAGKKPIITKKNAEAWLDSLPVESPRERRATVLPTGSDTSNRSYFGKPRSY
jgi:hypothetical protein